MRFLFLITLAAASHAFVMQPQLGRLPSALRVSSSDLDVPIIVNGQNLDLTPALIDHVNKKIGAPLKKLASHGAVTECDVILSVNKNPKVRNQLSDAIERGERVMSNLCCHLPGQRQRPRGSCHQSERNDYYLQG